MSGNTLNLKIFFQEKMYKNIKITRMVYLTIAKDSYLKFVSVYFECVYIYSSQTQHISWNLILRLLF